MNSLIVFWVSLIAWGAGVIVYDIVMFATGGVQATISYHFLVLGEVHPRRPCRNTTTNSATASVARTPATA
jgi:hypothetical protein